MPQYVSYSPWSDAANAMSGTTQGIGALALQIPQLRAQQMALKQQQALVPYRQQLMQAQAARLGKQGDLFSAQAAAKQAETTGMGNLQKAIASGDLRTAVSEMAYMGSKNPASLADAMMRMDAYLKSGLGSSGGHYSPENAQAAMGTRMKPTVVGQGGAAYGPDGSLVGLGQMRLPAGNVQGLPSGDVGAMSPYPPTQPKAGSLSSAVDTVLARALAEGNISTQKAKEIKALFPQAQQPVMPMSSAPSAPAPGTVMKGYKFLGGDPSKQESWQKVGEQ